MKVVLASFSKCGTKTLGSCFEELGMKNHDFPEHFEYNYDAWMKIFQHGGSREDFVKMYQNVDTVTDMPACYFWEEIIDAFPDCKVVLTRKSSDEVWYKSFKKQVREADGDNFSKLKMIITSPTIWKMRKFYDKMCQCMYKHTHQSSNELNEDLCREAYRKHNANVLENCPKERLLVYDLKEGWGPLCEFLQVPVPDKPFPHRNKGGVIIKELLDNHPVFIRMKREAFCVISLFAAFLSFLFYYIFSAFFII